MKNHFVFLILILCFYSSKIYSQKTPVLIDNNNTKYASINVFKTYERVAEKGYKSVDLFQKLGNHYYSNYELDKAAKWYGELFEMTFDLDPIYYYQYAHSLRAIGQKEKANQIVEKLNQKILIDTKKV